MFLQVAKVSGPLPIGLNRISWKREFGTLDTNLGVSALPIGLNRISWKLQKL
jgi:hypothetical protein